MEELDKIRERKMQEMIQKAQSPASAPPDRPVIVTDGDFEDALQKYNSMVVDCWAEWCAPCRMIAPVIEEMARKYAGKVAFGKLNVDDNMRIASQYGIMAIPTLLFFKNGKEVDRIIGAVPKGQIEAKINQTF
jgi:thioredoxin 1